MNLNDFIARSVAFFDKAEAAAPAVDTFKADLAASNSENTTLKTQAVESANRIKTLEADLAAKVSELTGTKDLLAKAENKANEVIAGQGIPADKLPPTQPHAHDNADTKLLDGMLAITDPQERTLFYRKNASAIKEARARMASRS